MDPYRANYYGANAVSRRRSDRRRHKTPSYDGAESGKRSSADVRPSRVDGYLMENYRHVYKHHDVAGDEEDDEDEDADADGGGGDICRSLYINEPVDFSPRFTAPPREVIRASKRFFASPGLASSLVEEARLSGAASSSEPLRPSDVTDASCSDRMAVTIESMDPYHDFRRSMVEMVTTHHADVGDSYEMLDWEFMEELLFSYLDLNDKSVHKDVLLAFVDVTAGFGRRARR